VAGLIRLIDTVIIFLQRYFSFVLVLSLLAPLWLVGASSDAASLHDKFRDALIWSGVLLPLWSLIRFRHGYQVKGVWRKPAPREVSFYTRLILGVLLIDFGSKALFFRWDRPYPIELLKNFGFHSVFHETPFEPFHVVVLIYFFYLFCLGGLFFRFANSSLDRIWIVSCAFALGGALALCGERLVFGGVHNSFYFAGPLMWICPPCASPRFSSYAWTPADIFVHAAFVPLIILPLSYFAPPKRRLTAKNGRPCSRADRDIV
jgi:hypothetical protein